MKNELTSAARAWDRFDLELMVTPPENGGQIVEVDYGSDGDYIFRRAYDRSDRSTTVEAYYRNDDSEYEPWNGSPVVGEYIGDIVGRKLWIAYDCDDNETSRHDTLQSAIEACDDNGDVSHASWRA